MPLQVDIQLSVTKAKRLTAALLEQRYSFRALVVQEGYSVLYYAQQAKTARERRVVESRIRSTLKRLLGEQHSVKFSYE